MSEQDTPMDALDQRLAAYLRGRAEIEAIGGPGTDALAQAIAGSRRVAGTRTTVRRMPYSSVPAVAWLLVVAGLLLVAVLAITGGSSQDPLVVAPPASAPPSHRPLADDHPDGSGDLRRMGARRLRLGDRRHVRWPGGAAARGRDDVLACCVVRAPTARSSSGPGAGGGCRVDGTWQATSGVIAIDVPTEVTMCEAGGPGPAAQGDPGAPRAGDSVHDGGRPPEPDGSAWRPPPRVPPPAGHHRARFDRTALPGLRRVRHRRLLHTAFSGPKVFTVPVGSTLRFQADGVVEGLVFAGGGRCNRFEGTFRRDLDGLAIEVPTTDGTCGDGPIHPDQEIRRRLARTGWHEFDGGTLRLVERNGNTLLVYRVQPADGVQPATGSPSPTETIEGTWVLDLAASSVVATPAGTGVVRQARRSAARSSSARRSTFG